MLMKNSQVHELTMFILSKVEFPSGHMNTDLLTPLVVEKYLAAYKQAAEELKKNKVTFTG